MSRARRRCIIATETSPTKTSKHVKWRTDIEGLRGIAVLLVVLYHAGVPGFAGGYVGVDVFFVLSGFLITGILVKEAEKTGTVDLARFYARRARRLLPAAFLLLGFVVAFSFLFYAPIAQVEIAKTAVASAAYASNIFFGLRATDYWANESETNPLLHTWSLAIEEQFYAVWPVLLLVFMFGLFFFRRASAEGQPRPVNRQGLIWGVSAVIIASFGLALYDMANLRSHWAFFSPLPRAWEFALGGLAALIQPKFASETENVRVPGLTQLGGWLGLAAVVACGLIYTSRTPFPGVTALLPVLGTLLILRAGSAEAVTPLSKLLSWNPLLELGRVSYSWYLWHWPPLVFATGLFGGLSLQTRFIIVVVSFFIAEASYRLVENPIRYNAFLGRKSAYGLYMLGGLTVLSVLLSGAWWQAAEAQMRSPQQQRFASARADLPDLFERGCHDELIQTSPAACSDGPEDAQMTVALYGDSHAAHWVPALQRIARDENWRLYYFTKSSCAGLEVTPYSARLGRNYTECDVWRAEALELLSSIAPELVIMSSYASEPYSEDEWLEGSRAAFEKLSQVADDVVIIRDPAHPEADVPTCLSHQVWRETLRFPIAIGDSVCDYFPRLTANQAVAELQIEAAAGLDNVHILDLSAQFCPGDDCLIEQNDFIMFRDRHHLSASFAEHLAQALVAGITDLTGGKGALSER